MKRIIMFLFMLCFVFNVQAQNREPSGFGNVGVVKAWIKGGLTSPQFYTSILPGTADGATIGSATYEWSDLFLADGSILYFGADQDVTLTHVADAALMLNAAMALRFRDSVLNINSSVDGQLDIDADTEIEMTTTTVDLNGALDVSGQITGAAGVDIGTSQAIVGTTALTLGDGTQTVTVNSSDWNIDATGNMSDIGTFGADGLMTLTAVTTGIDINGTSAGADINHYSIDTDYDQGAVAGGAYLSRGNITGVGAYVDCIGNIDHVYATRGGSYMAMAANTEVNQFYGGMFNANASGAHTMTLHDGLVGLKSTVTVDAGVTDVTGGLIAGLFINTQPIGKNLTTPTYGIYQKIGGYTDYGMAVQVGANNTTSGIRIQATDSAVLPNGLEISTNVGTIQANILTSSGAKMFTGTAANGDAVYAEVGSYDAVGSIYLNATNGYIYIQVANAGSEADWYKVTATNAD